MKEQQIKSEKHALERLETRRSRSCNPDCRRAGFKTKTGAAGDQRGVSSARGIVISRAAGRGK